MAKKKTSKAKNTVKIEDDPAKDTGTQMAAAMLRPSLQAGYALAHLHSGTEGIDLEHFVFAIGDQIEQMQQGDHSRMEAMLLTQAHTLDALFNKLTVKAFNADYTNQLETYLKLALKAQSQTQATLAALSVLKTPKQPAKIAYVQQANIAAGHQQVVNHGVRHDGVTGHGVTKQVQHCDDAGATEQVIPSQQKTAKTKKTPNKLLTQTEKNHGQTMDTSAKSGAITENQEVETVATRNRRKDSTRQNHSVTQCL